MQKKDKTVNDLFLFCFYFFVQNRLDVWQIRRSRGNLPGRLRWTDESHRGSQDFGLFITAHQSTGTSNSFPHLSIFFLFLFFLLLSQSIFRLLYPHQPITNKQTSHEWLDDWWISPPNVVCVICLINWKDRKSTKRTNASICSIMPTNSAPLKLAIWSDVVVRATSGHLFSAALLTVSFARAGKKKKKNRERVCC